MIEIVSAIASTNSALLARVAGGEPCEEGQWLIADRQSAGRGRAGRQWRDGLGNFMGSTCARARAGDPPAPTLSLVAGVALHRAIRAMGVTAPDMLLKWPNDVMVDGAKLAGILLERQGDAVVVGIGVNLVAAPVVPDRPTVALADLVPTGRSALGVAPPPALSLKGVGDSVVSSGQGVTRDQFASVLVHEWSTALALWHNGGWSALRTDWLARAHPAGTLLQVHDRDAGVIIGGFAGLSPDGAALLRLADGATHAIHAGDIELVRSR